MRRDMYVTVPYTILNEVSLLGNKKFTRSHWKTEEINKIWIISRARYLQEGEERLHYYELT